MGKLAKKRNDVKHTIEAYGTCYCYCDCWVGCYCQCNTADLMSGIQNSGHIYQMNSRQSSANNYQTANTRGYSRG